MNVLTLNGQYPRLHAEANLAVGESFEVHLPVTAATGYQWEIIEQPAGLVLAGSRVKNTSPEEIAGGRVMQQLRFRASHPTAGRLRLSYQRSWDQTSRIRDCVIDVRADGR